MNKFVTPIKTAYTNVPVTKEKKTFVSTYSSKNSRKAISGDNRNACKTFASKLLG